MSHIWPKFRVTPFAQKVGSLKQPFEHQTWASNIWIFDIRHPFLPILNRKRARAQKPTKIAGFGVFSFRAFWGVYRLQNQNLIWNIDRTQKVGLGHTISIQKQPPEGRFLGSNTPKFWPFWNHTAKSNFSGFLDFAIFGQNRKPIEPRVIKGSKIDFCKNALKVSKSSSAPEITSRNMIF